MSKALIQRVLTTDNSLSSLLMRLIAGAIFAAHGAQKLFGSFGGGKLSLDRLLSARLSNGRSDSF